MESIMHLFVLIVLYAALLYPSVLGIYFGSFKDKSENKNYGFDDTSEESQNDTFNIFNDDPEISNNVSEHPADEQRLESASDVTTSEIIRIEKSNSTFTSSSPSINNTPNTQNTEVEITLTEIFSNESNSTSSVTHSSSNSFSSTEHTKSNNKSTSLGTSTSKEIILSSTEDEEQEGVVRGKPSSTESTNITTSKYETIYQKAVALISDTYTLSILIPVSAGVLFASTILITIATCKCLRRQCRRGRLRKKKLPDSIKNLRPSDRARLLAESSDEEF